MFNQKHPDVVQKFVNAIKKAQQWANDHPDEAVAITSKHIGTTAQATHYYYTNKGFPEKDIQPWIDDLVRSGALKPGQIKVSDLITTQFSK